jgi:hypothetical protein
MRRLLREPLLHFLLLGAVTFATYRLVGGEAGGPSQIVVTPARLENLATTFARTWQRPPTEAELEGLIRDYVREEIYYREALAMGLDKDDTVVRRRLRQKLEFIGEGTIEQAEPSDEELKTWLAAHPEKFRAEPRFTFSQVYLNPERHRDSLAEDAARVLAQLRQAGASADPAMLGDPSLLEHRFENAPATEIAAQFGGEFADQVAALPLAQWTGPVQSGYGVHLVRVQSRLEGRMPALDEIRDAVRREWNGARQREASEQFYQALRERYTVTVERAEDYTGTARLAARP